MPTSDTGRPCWHLAGTGAVARLERKLARWYGLPHALAVSNATSGLMGVALALDLQGAEFVTTPYTWGGSVAPWLALGCRPVFADVEPRTLTLDPTSVAAHVTGETRAVLAVDIDGTPCQSRALREVADDHGLWFIVDAAQSLGATRGGRPAGVDADALVVSFATGKTVDAAEGGAVVTPHTWLYQRLLWHTQHPQRHARELGFGLTNELAINARIHPAAALEADDRFDDALAGMAARQDRCLAILRAAERSRLIEAADLPGADGCCPSFYRVAVTARPDAGEDVGERLEAHLHDAGFDVRVEPSPVNLVYRLPGFRADSPSSASCPVAEAHRRRRLVIRDTAIR